MKNVCCAHVPELFNVTSHSCFDQLHCPVFSPGMMMKLGLKLNIDILHDPAE